MREWTKNLRDEFIEEGTSLSDWVREEPMGICILAPVFLGAVALIVYGVTAVCFLGYGLLR